MNKDKQSSSEINYNLNLDLPIQFNKDYTISTYNNLAYLNKKLLSVKNELIKNANNNLSSSSSKVAGDSCGFSGQFKAAKLGLIESMNGLNSFGVKTDEITVTSSISNKESYVSTNSHLTSILCMTTVCTPSTKVDMVNNFEFVQCTLGCLANPKNLLSLYVYKNYNTLKENLKVKNEYATYLQTHLTSSLVREGLSGLCAPNSGLPVEQMTELEAFRSSLDPKAMARSQI